MKRIYDTGEETTNPTYFIGTEVERTCFYGMNTLFVTGLPPLVEIIEKAKENNIDHIFLGANHSIRALSLDVIDYIYILLDSRFKVTIDLDVRIGVYDYGIEDFRQNKNFCMILRFPLSAAEQYSNLYIKVDDYAFDSTNRGVWVANIIDDKNLTEWSEYRKDKIIES